MSRVVGVQDFCSFLAPVEVGTGRDIEAIDHWNHSTALDSGRPDGRNHPPHQ